MRKRPITFSAFILVLGLSASTVAAANNNPLCAAKEAEVQRQLDAARKQDNPGQMRGLEMALGKIREHCTDRRILAEAEEEVQDSLAELDERQQDLEEALQHGDTDDIEKRRKKLQAATKELEEHTQALAALRNSSL